MSKLTYGSRPNKIEQLHSGNYRCLYNIEEETESYPVIDPETHEPTGETETRPVWICDWVDVAGQPTTKNLVPALIRQRYSADDEFEKQRERDSRPEAYAEYNTYVESCKVIAAEILA